VSPATRGLYAAFAGLGATASAIPAVLPSVEQAAEASVMAAVPALFGGLFAGVLLSGPALRHLRALHLAAIGCLLQATALGGAALATTASTFIAFAALAGLGFGLTEAAASVAAKAESASSTTAAILTTLTATVAVAAALTPLLVAVAAGSDRHGLVLFVPAAVQVVAASALVAGARGTAAPPWRGRPLGLRRVSVIALLPLAVALPLYVGVETVFAGWSAVIPAELLHLDPAAAALGTSVFWGLMAVGRFASSVLLRRGMTPRRALLIAMLTAAALLGFAAIAAPALPVLGIAAIAAAVVALAPGYALVIGLALDRLDDAEAATATGALVACGAAGGSLVPAAVLLIAREPAGPATFVMTAILCLAIAALSAARLGTPRPATTGGRTA
jgi:hypothetical protein